MRGGEGGGYVGGGGGEGGEDAEHLGWGVGGMGVFGVGKKGGLVFGKEILVGGRVRLIFG